jgi:hypothetical protein
MEYAFVLKGTTPLLMHNDDVEAADELKKWRNDSRNKSISVPGDDRSPPWTWITYLHHDGVHLAMPQEAIMGALRHAGAKVNLEKGKGTFKSLTQSGLVVGSNFCRLTVNGRQIAVEDILKLRDKPFPEQKKGVTKLNPDLELLVKRARIGQTKNVRVRLMFNVWEVESTIIVQEPAITPSILQTIFELSGRISGLLDWRPNSKFSPGPHGMYMVELKPVKARKAG